MYTFNLISWLIPRLSHTFFPSLPNAELAFENMLLTSTSMLASLERMLPRKINESVAFSGSCIHTYVWLMIHRSRCTLVHDFCLLGADGKTKVVASTRQGIQALLLFRFSVAVKSAVIRREEFTHCATFTFVFALSHLRLNTPPYVMYFSWMTSSLSCEAWQIMQC